MASIRRLSARSVGFAVLVCVLLGVLIGIGGASTSSPKQADKPLVYASFYPIYSLVSTIAGDDVDVRSFMPPNQDPHLWEPSARDIQELSRADMLVVNGANMEPWLPHIQAALPDLTILNLSDYVELITYKGAAALGEFQFMGRIDVNPQDPVEMVFGHMHEKTLRGAFFRANDQTEVKDLVERGRDVMNDPGRTMNQHENIRVEEGQVYDIRMGHEHGDVRFTFPEAGEWIFVSDRASEAILSYSFHDSRGATLDMPPVIEGGSAKTENNIFDPHSWMSIVNGKRYANAINDQLKQRYPEHADDFQNRKRKLVSELSDIQSQFREKLRDTPKKEFLTSHNAFAYLARDYGLNQYALQGLTTKEAPRLRVLTDAIQMARRSGINTVFYEYGSDAKTATVLAEELEGNARPLCSMEYGGIGTDSTYADIMKYNVDSLYQALSSN